MSTDRTREFAQQMQAGVHQVKTWDWGPLRYCTVIYPNGYGWSLILTIGSTAYQFCSTTRTS